ncbi:unnamed protein product [Gordionus sp. m RMFG-2023]
MLILSTLGICGGVIIVLVAITKVLKSFTSQKFLNNKKEKSHRYLKMKGLQKANLLIPDQNQRWVPVIRPISPTNNSSIRTSYINPPDKMCGLAFNNYYCLKHKYKCEINDEINDKRDCLMNFFTSTNNPKNLCYSCQFIHSNPFNEGGVICSSETNSLSFITYDIQRGKTISKLGRKHPSDKNNLQISLSTNDLSSMSNSYKISSLINISSVTNDKCFNYENDNYCSQTNFNSVDDIFKNGGSSNQMVTCLPSYEIWIQKNVYKDISLKHPYKVKKNNSILKKFIPKNDFGTSKLIIPTPRISLPSIKFGNFKIDQHNNANHDNPLSNKCKNHFKNGQLVMPLKHLNGVENNYPYNFDSNQEWDICKNRINPYVNNFIKIINATNNRPVDNKKFECQSKLSTKYLKYKPLTKKSILQIQTSNDKKNTKHRFGEKINGSNNISKSFHAIRERNVASNISQVLNSCSNLTQPNFINDISVDNILDSKVSPEPTFLHFAIKYHQINKVIVVNMKQLVSEGDIFLTFKNRKDNNINNCMIDSGICINKDSLALKNKATMDLSNINKLLVSIELELLPERKRILRTRNLIIHKVTNVGKKLISNPINLIFDEKFEFFDDLTLAQLVDTSIQFKVNVSPYDSLEPFIYDNLRNTFIWGKLVVNLNEIFHEIVDKEIHVYRELRYVDHYSIAINSFVQYDDHLILEQERCIQNHRGDILLSLCYSRSTQTLNLIILRARNLYKSESKQCIDPYVKIFLKDSDANKILNKYSTRIRLNTYDPVFNETVKFGSHLFNGAQKHDKSLKSIYGHFSMDIIVNDSNQSILAPNYKNIFKKRPSKLIGRILIESNPSSQDQTSDTTHWIESWNNPDKIITKWHTLMI